MADENTNSIEGAKFYYEPWVDRKNRLRTKTVCIQKITIDYGAGKTEIYYAYGAAGHCLLEECKVNTGQRIAKRRAEKALEIFGKTKYDFKFYNAHNGYDGCVGYRLWMNILTPEEAGELEKKLLPFNEVPKDEKVNITTLYDKADFGDKSMEEAAGITNYDDKKDEKPADNYGESKGFLIGDCKVVVGEEDEKEMELAKLIEDGVLKIVPPEEVEKIMAKKKSEEKSEESKYWEPHPP